ncbi:MAG: metallophosphoesterase [Clostridia bacterium]|nr:metallophosphoesterase [Clostridia bacterium]
MNKKIKFLTLLLAFCFTASFAACNIAPLDSSKERVPESVVIIPGENGGEIERPGANNDTAKYLQAKATKAGRVTLEKDSDCPADFVLSVEGDEELRILQITDTQMIDETQVRLGNGAVSSRYADHDDCVYDIVRYVVDQTKPDLILLTGDFVYGDYDDNGSLFREQTDFFDSLGIYWAPIFGNHDNDSDSNYAIWLEEGWNDWYGRKQCSYFEQAEYCLFRTRVDLSGYSNYSIAIKQNDEFVRSIFMLDTHGSHQTTQEIKQVQLNWYTQSVKAINAFAGKNVPNFVAIHVPLYAFNLAAQQYGYVYGTVPNIEIPANSNGDWGYLLANPGGMDKNMTAFNTFKAGGADAILAGHEHMNNASILYDGVRLVFGTKSSKYDKYNDKLLGATLFTVNGASFVTSPVYYVES